MELPRDAPIEELREVLIEEPERTVVRLLERVSMPEREPLLLS
jgi:hypothetical protein